MVKNDRFSPDSLSLCLSRSFSPLQGNTQSSVVVVVTLTVVVAVVVLTAALSP